MARPKCTKETIAKAVKLRKAGVNNKDIAAAVGVCEQTFSKWINHPKTDNQRELGEALKRTEADYKAALLSIIYNDAVKKDWKAAAWLLERKYPQEFARQERIQAEAKVDTAPTIVFKRDV